MIVQFFDYGSGLSKGPLDYLLGKDRAREHAKIISGHEQEIAELIDSSPFAKKYTSGCLSFYEDDLSEEAKKQIMANFEQCLFPGMNETQYRVLWIEHRDKVNEATGGQRLELNFLIPNIEIESGQRLQPYYHEADLPRVDLFKKITNFEYQLHDPNDPLFRQAVTTKKSLPKKIEDIKAVIDIEAQKAIEAGLITDRASMTKWLIDLGLEVENEKKKSISIKNPHATSENSRNIRLTGAIYEQDFRVTAESAELTREASERHRQEAKQRNEGDIQRYRAYIERKSTELNDKYRHNTKEHTREAERIHSEDYRADRQEHPENFRNADQAAGAVHSRSTSEISAVKQLEYRDSESLEDPRYSFEIKYSPDFDSLYSSYFQHCNERNQLREIHANSGQKSSNRSHRQSYPIENAGVGRFIHSDLQHQQESQIEQKDEYGSTVIADYRAATTAAAESIAAVAGAAESLESASASYRRARSIHSDLESETQRGLADSEAVSADRAAAIRADYLRAFFKGLTAAVSKRFKSACDEVASVFGLAGADKSLSARASAEADASRAREADPSFSAEAGSETRLGLQLSRAFKGFSSEPIRKAAVVLAQRKEAAKEKARDNDGPTLGW